MPLPYSSAYALDGFLLPTTVKSSHLALVDKVCHDLGKLLPLVPSPTTTRVHSHLTPKPMPLHGFANDSLPSKGPFLISWSKCIRLQIQLPSATFADPPLLPHCSPLTTVIQFLTLYCLSFLFKAFPSVCFLRSRTMPLSSLIYPSA